MLFMLYLFEITNPTKRIYSEAISQLLCSLLQNVHCNFSDLMNVVFNFWLNSIYQIVEKVKLHLHLNSQTSYSTMQ